MVSVGEESVFRAFLNTCPDFAGRELHCELGADPPDFLGTDTTGRRVGIELGEWLNPQQMAASLARERQKDSVWDVLRSEEEEPPQNIGFIWIGKANDALLREEDASEFRDEAYRCVQDVDSRWRDNADCESPQGYLMTDFAAFPCLAKYLSSLTFIPRTRMPTIKGIAWFSFRPEGGAYTPGHAVGALLDLLHKKTDKYVSLHKEENLDELYLVAYYDRALIHNTPFVAPNFGWDEVAAIAAAEVARNPGAFQKIFLFNALPQDRTVTLLWG